MARLEDAVRGIIQFPYESQSQGKIYAGVLLELQRHPKTKEYSYILPGGRLGEQSYEDALCREIDEELGIEVRDIGPFYEYSQREVTTRVYIVNQVHAPYRNIRANNKKGEHEVHGLGGYNIGSQNQIPDRFMVGHVAALKDDFYHPNANRNKRRYSVSDVSDYNRYIGQLTQGLPKLDGYFNDRVRHPGIMTWDEQRQNWGKW